MAVEYIDVQGITSTAIVFRSTIRAFDDCITQMDNVTNNVLRNWVGRGRNQFETQMAIMKGQLDDISDTLYDVYNALVDAETGYIDQDEAVAKQFSVDRA